MKLDLTKCGPLEHALGQVPKFWTQLTVWPVLK